MNRRMMPWLVVGAGAVVSLSLPRATSKAIAAETSPATVEKGFVLKEEPKKAQGVLTVKKGAKNGQEVVVVGRIGGRKNPWIKGAAAFSIVDESLKSCDQREGDSCPTPWDYCCAAGLPKATMFVTFVDESGKVVKKDAREFLKVKELQTVVVQGKVKRDKADNVSLIASKVYVRTSKGILR